MQEVGVIKNVAAASISNYYLSQNPVAPIMFSCALRMYAASLRYFLFRSVLPSMVPSSHTLLAHPASVKIRVSAIGSARLQALTAVTTNMRHPWSQSDVGNDLSK